MSFNICIVAQPGRLACDALLFMLSFRAHVHDPGIKVHVCTPRHTTNWTTDPDIRGSEVADALTDLGATIVPFDNPTFGSAYPHSNKVYALASLPPDEPFVFFDTDHLIIGDLGALDIDFAAPTCAHAGTPWPHKSTDMDQRAKIWDALYAMFDLPTEGWYRDLPDNDLRRFPYFNGGCFYHASAGEFLAVYREVMEDIHLTPPSDMAGEQMFPWLDQIALPIVMRRMGGRNDMLRGSEFIFADSAIHYFSLPRFYMAPLRDHLETVQAHVRTADLSHHFRANPVYDHYLFGEGGALIEELLADKSLKIAKFGQLKRALMARGAWRKR